MEGNIVKQENAMGSLVKFVKAVIQRGKNQYKLKKLKIIFVMKILGIGNAIVDVICKVDDLFLKNNSLTKSTMKLVNEHEFKNLISNLKIGKQYQVARLLTQSLVFPS